MTEEEEAAFQVEVGILSKLDQANILNLKFNIHLIGFENKQILEYGSREWFYNKYGLDVKSLTKSIDNILNG